ncbi:hypothetical protein D3C80_1782450 [compost metagenome]
MVFKNPAIVVTAQDKRKYKKVVKGKVTIPKIIFPGFINSIHTVSEAIAIVKVIVDTNALFSV